MSDRVARLAEIRRNRDGNGSNTIQDAGNNQQNILERSEESIAHPDTNDSALAETSGGLQDPQDRGEQSNEPREMQPTYKNSYNSDLKHDIAHYLTRAQRETEAALNRHIVKKAHETSLEDDSGLS